MANQNDLIRRGDAIDEVIHRYSIDVGLVMKIEDIPASTASPCALCIYSPPRPCTVCEDCPAKGRET